MSGKTILLPIFRSDPISRKSLRYAIGIVMAIGVAFGFNWPLSFLVIVLAHTFLLGPKLPYKAGFGFIVLVVISVFFGILLSNFLLDYTFIYLMVIGVILLQLYYVDSSTLSPILKLFLIIWTLTIPLISLQSPALGSLVGIAFVTGAIVALLITWFVFALLPDLEPKHPVAKPVSSPPPLAPTSRQRYITAVKSLTVVYPIVLLFYFFDWQSSALILIYVGMYSSFSGFAKDFTMGKGLLVGCITGGIIAFLIYEVVIVVPVFSFMLLLFFGISLWIGNEILTGGRYAEPIKAGASTIFIIFSGAVGSDEVDAGGKMISRVLQIAIVVIYMVFAFGLIEKLFPSKTVKKAL